ncbi:MAG: UDP-3-O-(3-hydroxymyristoyl)glucosamine N-acyltransferase [Planctomycetota bacterium]|nr:UDP-3-O-(3-hydroxymyristoyl)glucosamine N-acyltransferase [Planctomycetota bacterium]MDA1113271.1 UDP-3-O-(3-hydroxymyristoyl)glucosamine N-acyltransferase [Planctomycetota bacterium]
MNPGWTPEPGTPLNAEQVAALVDGTLEGETGQYFEHVRDLESATKSDVVFFRSGPNGIGRAPAQAELEAFQNTAAGLLLVDALTDASGRACIRVANPALAAAKLAQHWESYITETAMGIHPTAVVDKAAKVDISARIGPHCVIAAGAVIGAHANLVSGVHVGEGSRVGDACVLNPGVVLGPRVEMGQKCVVQANTVIGSAGFGYVWSGSEHVHMPQMGGVQIGERVEIGANSCIDAGTFQPTVIGDNCLLDNHVQIGHNSKLGRFVILCGKVGISGSVEIGDGAIFAGSSGAAGHNSIGPGAKIAVKAVVTSNVPAGATYAGNPAVDYGLHQRMQIMLRRMARKKK